MFKFLLLWIEYEAKLTLAHQKWDYYNILRRMVALTEGGRIISAKRMIKSQPFY